LWGSEARWAAAWTLTRASLFEALTRLAIRSNRAAIATRRPARGLHELPPIAHGASPAGIETYKVEPYVVAADVYAVAPHIGRGGWTWYTGSAAWMGC